MTIQDQFYIFNCKAVNSRVHYSYVKICQILQSVCQKWICQK